MKCGKCGIEIKEGTKFCTNCGSKVDELPSKKYCAKCGKELNSNEKFCKSCGQMSETPKNNNINFKPIIIILIIAGVLGYFIFKDNSKETGINLSKIYNEIGCTYEFCKLASDGSYLEIDTNPDDEEEYFSYEATKIVEKANKALGFTDALYNRMGKTRALDGTLTDENPKIKVSWTYHPDDGLEVVYSKK